MFTVVLVFSIVGLVAQSSHAVPSASHYGGPGYGAAYGAGYGVAGYAVGYGGPRYQGPLAIPVVLPDGHIADTPEVATAKNAHLIAVSKAAELSGYGGYDDGSYGYGVGYGRGYGGYGAEYSGLGYAGAGHNGIYGGAGYAGSYGGAGYAGIYGGAGYGGIYGGAGYAGGYVGAGYQGPIANPVVLPSGYLADTPDVATNKRAHLNALSLAAQRHALWTPYSRQGYH